MHMHELKRSISPHWFSSFLFTSLWCVFRGQQYFEYLSFLWGYQNIMIIRCKTEQLYASMYVYVPYRLLIKCIDSVIYLRNKHVSFSLRVNYLSFFLCFLNLNLHFIVVAEDKIDALLQFWYWHIDIYCKSA